MLLEFQDDARFAEVYDQVMLGDRILLAPVVEAGATSRKIKLPAGTWHDFWSTQSHEGGGEIEYPAPLDRLPLLVRGGSVLPLGPVLQHIPDGHRFDQLELHCYPPYPAEFVLYDDDGLTRAYQRGKFSTTRITTTEDGRPRSATTIIRATEGDFAGQPASRRITVVLHRASEPGEVRVNGEAREGWEYQAQRGCVTVAVECPTRKDTVIDIAFS
jgi:alpha-glucosidase